MNQQGKLLGLQSRKFFFRLTSFSFYNLFFLALFLAPLFRGVIYPVERILFTLLILFIFCLWQCRSFLGKGLFFFEFFEDDCKNWSLSFLCLLVLIWIQTLVVSQRFQISIIRLIDFTAFFLVFVLAIAAFKKKHRREQAFFFIVGTSTLYAFLGILYHSGFLTHPWWEKADLLSATYVNHNHYAGFLELGSFVTMGMVLAGRSQKPLLPLFCLFLQWFSLLLTLSRGAWIASFLTFFWIGLLLIRNRYLFRLGSRIMILFFTVLVLFFTYSFSGVNPDLQSRLESFITYQGQREFLDFRVRLWDSTIHAIETKPWFGYGAGSFAFSMREFRKKGFEFAFDYAHNDYLQFAMELGLILFIPALILIFLILKNAYSGFYSVTLEWFRFENLGLLSACVCIFLHGWVDFNLHIYANSLYFSFFLGLLASSFKQEYPQNSQGEF